VEMVRVKVREWFRVRVKEWVRVRELGLELG
jgi:hypothetical protein